VTSTRGKGIFAVLAISAALLVPTAATADSSYSSASSSASAAKRVPFSVTFTSLTRDGKIVAVKDLKFHGLKANCNNGKSVTVHGRFPRMPVNNRKFRSTVVKDSGTVKVKGQFRHHGQKVTGRFKATGTFGNAFGCFGVHDYHASQN
jgi:hypothetical protein